jgi:hypothetical protein
MDATVSPTDPRADFVKDPTEAQTLEKLRTDWRQGIESGDAGDLDFAELKQAARTRFSVA